MPTLKFPRIAYVAAPLLLAACAAPAGHPLLLATLYSNTAAEYSATAKGLYRSAEAQMDILLGDPVHTAALEQESPHGRPAVILDVDETVLDNSPFEVRLIEDHTSYPTGWDEWCNQATAKAVPGALEFTTTAASMGVTVFYVTNRKAHLEDGTRRNLVALGFPMGEDIDTLLMRGEREDWTSDKTTRRAHVAKDFRVLMLFGDNMGDFVSLADAKGTPAERQAAVDEHAERWGREWVMLPNPMYGYWESAVLGDATDPTDEEINRLRIQAMDPMR